MRMTSADAIALDTPYAVLAANLRTPALAFVTVAAPRPRPIAPCVRFGMATPLLVAATAETPPRFADAEADDETVAVTVATAPRLRRAVAEVDDAQDTAAIAAAILTARTMLDDVAVTALAASWSISRG